MDLTYWPLQVSILTAGALLATVIGLLSLLRRGHWLVTLLFSSAFLSIAAFQAGTVGFIQTDSGLSERTWATYLAGVSALASWLWLALSVVLARPDPWKQIRDAGAYLTLALTGCVILWAIAGSEWVVRGVTGSHGDAVIVLGSLGKIYLMYLVVVMLVMLMNFEGMLRIAPVHAQRWLRPLFVAFLLGILSELLVVSGGLMFGELRVAWLAASGVPLFVAGAVTAMALARRRLSDMSVPVARPVIYYSSVSLTVAGAFLLLMTVLSKVVPMLSPEARRLVGLAFYLLVGGGGLLLAVSPRVNRAVKHFVDRNLYANRYDYRREWERVSAGIVPTARLEDVCRQIDALVCSIFGAERVALYARDERLAGLPGTAAPFRLLHGPAGLPSVVEPDNPLVRELERTRAPVVFRDLRHDLDLIPLAVENRPTIQVMEAAACAPLQAGDNLVGLLWLSKKRDGDEYSFEDAEFLGSMARHLGAVLWFARLAEQLAEARQLESLNRLSSYVLHDIKNQISGLSLVVQTARRYMDNPDFQRDTLKTLEGTVASLTQLTNQVAGMARPTDLNVAPCDVRAVLDEAAVAAGLAGPGAALDGVRFRCDSRVGTAALDRRLMVRVLVNLLTNAHEALGGAGEIELTAVPGEAAAGAGLVFRVRDTGRGMSEEFIRTSLFRPFATTKPTGLGIGLSQCRSIVQAMGGAITVESRPGAGTTFAVHLPVERSENAGTSA